MKVEQTCAILLIADIETEFSTWNLFHKRGLGRHQSDFIFGEKFLAFHQKLLRELEQGRVLGVVVARVMTDLLEVIPETNLD